MQEHAFLGRITRPYADLSGMFIDWAGQCESIWVYEHTADEKVNKTHCHLLVVGSQRDADGLKKRVSWKTVGIDKGNTGSSFKKYDSQYEMQYLTYMTKGNLKPVFCSGVEVESKAEEARLKWVDKKEEGKKQRKNRVKDYFDIVEEIRNEVSYREVLTPYGIWEKRIKSFDEVYDKFLEKMEKYRIRTSETDVDRWFYTILRNDPSYGQNVRQRMKDKYDPEKNKGIF